MKTALFAAACLLSAAVQAQPVPEDAGALVEKGLRALYFLDYAGAKEHFGALKRSAPDDPLGHYAESMALWWELTNAYDESNPALEKEFLAAVEKAVAASQAAVKKAGFESQAQLCLGGALGLQARWEAINGQWLAAYRHGRRAFKAQERAVALDPEAYDAYLGLGIFHYYTATLPAAVKVLAKMMFGGDKEQGLSEIRLAMEKGVFSRTPAKLFMVGILVNNEKTPEKALPLVREGRKEFEGSPFFHLLEMLVLEEADEWDALEREARDFLDRLDRKEPFYVDNLRHRALWSLGNAALGRGETARAARIYDDILKDFPGEDRWITLTHLNRGRARDRLGDRDGALADYKEVLRRRDVWQLHEKASRHIKTPDRP